MNRGVARAPIFSGARSYQRFIKTLDYYRFENVPVKLSVFLKTSLEDRLSIQKNLEQQDQKLVEVLCYCAMPNHFHLLIKQLKDNGISNYIRKVSNSYAKYFNVKNKRVGPLLQGPFKSLLMETDEQLIHVSRYIHINPYLANLIKRDQLKNYQYSSLPAYISDKFDAVISKKPLLEYFKNEKEYKKFVYDQVDYKKIEEEIKHLFIEKNY